MATTSGVPACEYQSMNCVKVDARRVGEALHELLDRRGLAVVAREIEVHALAEVVGAEQRLEHAHDLGAFLVDGRRVEVVDLAVERRPHRMGEGAGVLDELVRAQARARR